MSAKDPIEELFRDNQHGLDEQPRGLLWNRIEEKLEEKPNVSKKNNWWKYAAAACLVFGLSFASYIFLYDSNLPAEQSQETGIVHQPTEITKENASEILDKLEEEKQSIVTTQKSKQAPEIFNHTETPSKMDVKTPEIYDFAPASAPIYEPIPQMTEAKEIVVPESEKAEDASIVFRGETPNKKSKNYITQKDLDERRMGNMAESSVMYESADASLNQISVPVKNALVQYDLISRTDSSIVFKNQNIAYPNEVLFKKVNDSFEIIYKGNASKKKSKESKAIQKYFNDNQSDILLNFGLN